jgi:hypothetical protein
MAGIQGFSGRMASDCHLEKKNATEGQMEMFYTTLNGYSQEV